MLSAGFVSVHARTITLRNPVFFSRYDACALTGPWGHQPGTPHMVRRYPWVIDQSGSHVRYTLQ